MRSALAFAALSLATALLLTGCTPLDPDVLPPPEQSTEPVFASDEEALAAATDAYKAYLAMSDLIAQEGGVNPERIAPLVTEEWLDKEIHWSHEFASRNWHLVGAQSVTSTSLQQTFVDSDSTVIVIYACIDLAEVKMLDASGRDVTPPELGMALAQEVRIQTDGHGSLLLAGSESWTGGSAC